MSRVILKRSSVPSKVPQAADLEYGELAINYADGVAYFKKSDNTIGTLGGSSATSQPHSYTYTATADQTTFSCLYDSSRVYVYLNGVKQILDYDFTAETGSSIEFATGLISGDIVDIVSYTGTSELTGLQAELVSGTNIKTINGTSLLGSGDITISSGSTLPDQTDNGGKYLKTDGSTASWSTLPTTLNILTRAASTVGISLGNGVLSVLNHSGSTISVSVS